MPRTLEGTGSPRRPKVSHNHQGFQSLQATGGKKEVAGDRAGGGDGEFSPGPSSLGEVPSLPYHGA